MSAETLFPIDLPDRQWLEFRAAGFPREVSGVVFRAGQASCGVPLGGVGTGCMDLDTDGTLGRCSIFNTFVPHHVLAAPFLALANRGRVHALTTRELPGTAPARQIHYWGHYPITDLEYETARPLSVGLRAWSPFLPGDAAASNTPAALFEVHVRNTGDSPETGRLVFSFPGPSPQEAGSTRFERTRWNGPNCGAVIRTGANAFLLGVIGHADCETGRALGEADWAGAADALPPAREADSGASLALDFELPAGGETIFRICLAWYFPRWAGSNAHHYLHAYATRFASAGEVADSVAAAYDRLLGRILAWQSEVYGAAELPPWLRDQLVNILHTIPEDSFWAGRSFPRAPWYEPAGLFAMAESPRTTPHVCNPSDWYGGLPIDFFFPELAAALLRAYVHYQLPTGEIPLGIGEGADLDFPSYHLFQAMNGCVHVHLIDRLWQRTANRDVLRELYPSARAAIGFVETLDTDADGLIELDADPIPNQFYGDWPWYGAAIHVNGFWLSAVRMAERMAEAAGDLDFAAHCRACFDCGARSLERKLWNGEYYLLYRDEAGGRSSDTILANQLVGESCSRLHGLGGLFPPEHVQSALATVRRTCMTPHGARNAIRPGGDLDTSGGRQSTGIFTGECIATAATLAYAGDRVAALDLARRMMEDIVIRQRAAWDMPNILDGASGAVLHGTDFYQMMILWAMPLALLGQGIGEACASGSLIDRIVRAGRG